MFGEWKLQASFEDIVDENVKVFIGLGGN